MKNLIYTLSLFIALSITAQPIDNSSASATNASEDNNLLSILANITIEDEVNEEKESPFDFDISAYLPEDFDPYKGMIVDESHLLEEEVAEFDFNTKKYLPVGFDAYEGMIMSAEVIEEETPFEFDTNDYLPLGFNANIDYNNLEKMVYDEEDAEFDFEIEKYLPKNFDAYTNMSVDRTSTIEVCEIYPTI